MTNFTSFLKCFIVVWIVPFLVTASIDKRISGGGAAGGNQFPFTAHLDCTTADGKNYMFAGVLVTDEWILSTARCTDLKPISITAILGSVDRTSTSKRIVNMNDIKVEKKLVLLQLAEQIKGDPNIRPIIELDGLRIEDEEYLITLGWGRTVDGGEPATSLMYTYLKTMSNSDCNRYYPGITNDLLCANGTHIEGICGGDVGGPLFYYGGSGSDYLVGISDGVLGCGQGNPSVFVRTENYVEWILKTTGKFHNN